MFRKITQNETLSEDKIRDYFKQTNNNLELALNRYLDDEQRNKKKEELLQQSKDVIDVNTVRHEKDAFKKLEYGTVMEYNKKKLVNDCKKSYQENYQKFAKNTNSDKNTSDHRKHLLQNTVLNFEHVATIRPLSNENKEVEKQLEECGNANNKKKKKLGSKIVPREANTDKKMTLSHFFSPKKLNINIENLERNLIESPKKKKSDSKKRKDFVKASLSQQEHNNSTTKLKKRSHKEMESEYKEMKNSLEENYICLGQSKTSIRFTQCLSARIPVNEILTYRAEIHKKPEGLPSRLKIKNPKAGYFYLYYDNIELCRVTEFEENYFKLLNDGVIHLEVIIAEESDALEGDDYVLDVFFFIKLSFFTVPIPSHAHLSKKYQTLSSKYEKYREEIQRLFENINLTTLKSSPFRKIKDEKAHDFFVKQNFYKFIDNFEFCTESYQDHTPYPIFNYQLHEFQKYGLSWLLKKEIYQLQEYENNEDCLNPMWNECRIELMLLTQPEDDEFQRIFQFLRKQNNKNLQTEDYKIFFYFNIFTGQLSLNYPYYDYESYMCGGILADEMGLGKTIMMLALIGYSILNSNHSNKIVENHKDKQTRNSITNSQLAKTDDKKQLGGTLIVLPSVLVHQWENEINNIFSNNRVRYFIYKDINKKEYIDLSGYDVVLTSYGIVRQDFFIQDYYHNLFKYKWLRIILDEANRIHNINSQNAKAVMNLEGCAKWCLTGTPIENSINDLYSLIQFMNYEPWSNKPFWDKMIYNPLYKERNFHAIEVLKSVIKPLLLRRTKSNHVEELNLMPIKYINIQIELDEDERLEYETRLKRENLLMDKMSDEIKTKVFHIYEIIMRLRQLCNHKRLPYFGNKPIKQEHLVIQIQKFLEARQKYKKHIDGNYLEKKYTIEFLFNCLSEKDNGECSVCPICKDEFEDPVLTVCCHKFCRACILSAIKVKQECCLCRHGLEREDLYKLPQ